jgi:hypothetical protein
VQNDPLSNTDPLGLWSDAIGSGSFFQSQLDASNRNIDFSFDRWADWNVRQTFGGHYYDLPGHNNPMASGRASYLSSIPGYSVAGGQFYAHFGFYTPNPDYDPDSPGDLLGTSTSIDVLLGSVETSPANNAGSDSKVSVGYTANVIVPFFYGLGPAVTYTKIPSLNLTCVGGGLGASAGHNFSFGPTVVSTQSAKSILSSWSFSAGYNFTPWWGAGGSGNSSGVASGNTFGVPGAGAAVTWSKCW